MKGKSRMPVAIMAMGIVFNVLNGMMQAGGHFYFNEGVPTGIGLGYLLEPHALNRTCPCSLSGWALTCIPIVLSGICASPAIPVIIFRREGCTGM